MSSFSQLVRDSANSFQNSNRRKQPYNTSASKRRAWPERDCLRNTRGAQRVKDYVVAFKIHSSGVHFVKKLYCEKLSNLKKLSTFSEYKEIGWSHVGNATQLQTTWASRRWGLQVRQERTKDKDDTFTSKMRPVAEGSLQIRRQRARSTEENTSELSTHPITVLLLEMVLEVSQNSTKAKRVRTAHPYLSSTF
ncbi:uncharacterized protein LOC143147862 [Ptiloglossa arizonensis]|uniref:uncharacterized protein LOC143147862 n=1 Tax=Ptiloglossa arizonensis TaxID=3350558 RepID=UPI003F9FCFBF